MNETGVLGAFIPDFQRVVALMQFNMYHSYTVDEHTIGLIRELHMIESGELDEQLPIASRIMRGQINRPVLFLAAFLHDVGKGQERPHSDIGAEVAIQLCPRLGLNDADTETVAWLVQNHLLMSDVAQTRDIADSATIRAFAKQVQSPERLKFLLVLTACDIRAVGPTAWNNWKAQLLRQLYRETYNLLTGGEAVGGRDDQVQKAQQKLRARLEKRGWDKDEIERILARQYPSYWIALDADTQALHATMQHTAGDRLLVTRFRPDESRDATKACF
jgi:[protein-PII] uridylyltransferase